MRQDQEQQLQFMINQTEGNEAFRRTFQDVRFVAGQISLDQFKGGLARKEDIAVSSENPEDDELVEPDSTAFESEGSVSAIIGDQTTIFPAVVAETSEFPAVGNPSAHNTGNPQGFNIASSVRSSNSEFAE